MKNAFKPAALAMAVAAVISASSQTYASGDEVLLEEIIVTAKLKKSLVNSVEQKRFADTVIEAISMEDIGVLPGKSIAESLIALPGVAGARNDDGSISKLSIRGAQDLALSTLNGRELVSGSASRTVNFGLYPSTVVSQAQVHKSSKASLIEGGLSGVVNMDTLKPFDFEETRVVITGQASDAQGADDVPMADAEGARGSLTYIDQLSDSLGVVASLSYANEPVAREGSLSPFSWGTYGPGQDLDGDGEIGDEHLPWGFIARHQGGEEERMGVFFDVQWIASDNVETNFDILYSDKSIEGEAQHTQYGGFMWNSAERFSNLDFVGDDLAAATIDLNPWAVPNAVAANGQEYSIDEEVVAGGYNIKWNLEQWTLVGDLSYSKAEQHYTWNSFNLNMDQASELVFDYQAYGDSPSLAVSGSDITDPTLWSPTGWFTLGVSEGITDDEMIALRLDGEHHLDMEFGNFQLKTLKVGTRYYDREKSLDVISSEASYVSGHPFSPNNDGSLDVSPLDSSYVAGIMSADNAPDMIMWDFDRIVDRLGGYRRVDSVANLNRERTASWEVQEDSLSFYVQLDFSGEWFFPYSGNIGLRYIDTDSQSPGWVDFSDGNPAVATSAGNSYTEVLPSLNLSFDLTDEQVLRLGWAKVLNRPNIDDMRSSSAVFYNSLADRYEGSGGNPELDPTIAEQASLSYEWYPQEGTSLVLAAHYSDLESFVAEFTRQTTFNGQAAQVAGVGNGEGGYIRGLEVTLLKSFDQLPAPFNGLGVSANYSYTETNVDPSPDDPFGLIGLSRDVANASVWWAGEHLEARLGADYRSEYEDIDGFGNFLTVNDVTIVSTSVAYNFNKDLRVNLFVNNLTDEERNKYTGGVPQRTESIMNFGRIIGLGVHYNL
ncbi:TonB-dependent receptor [Pseudomaricurvus alkylphenolicus]|uniref:TonB-dependent receptor n=1 Tax=Pseudomaricurvus alkylphenolicus TaxID=1306991 RepID=UPI001423437C|nr:TonB-dependent receptor [Pseudomaricurvus alkylphenolicus]NIB38236.1 TonB-dependent receptor [Pseudomaricurvus alkylphenolicus]